MEVRYDHLGIEWLLGGLKTHAKNGIDSSSVAWRAEAYGTNEVATKPPACSV